MVEAAAEVEMEDMVVGRHDIAARQVVLAPEANGLQIRNIQMGGCLGMRAIRLEVSSAPGCVAWLCSCTCFLCRFSLSP